jgi:hypothetical protein
MDDLHAALYPVMPQFSIFYPSTKHLTCQGVSWYVLDRLGIHPICFKEAFSMRGILKKIRDFDERILDWIAEAAVKGPRLYTVRGAIVFIFKPPVGMESGIRRILRGIIEEVDEKFPWKDEDIPNKTGFKSIFYLCEGHSVIQNFSTQEQHIWFTIVPQYDSMRRPQLYAYEKYLTKLAEELSRRLDLRPCEVRAALEIRISSRTFRSKS